MNDTREKPEADTAPSKRFYLLDFALFFTLAIPMFICAVFFLLDIADIVEQRPWLLAQVPEGTIGIYELEPIAFGSLRLIIETDEGVFFGYTRDKIAPWKVVPQHTLDDSPYGDECSQKALRILQSAGGEIADCKQGIPPHEWVPSPMEHYAITTNGDVWHMTTGYYSGLQYIFWGVCGGSLGLFVDMLLILMRWFERRKKTQADFVSG